MNHDDWNFILSGLIVVALVAMVILAIVLAVSYDKLWKGILFLVHYHDPVNVALRRQKRRRDELIVEQINLGSDLQTANIHASLALREEAESTRKLLKEVLD